MPSRSCDAATGSLLPARLDSELGRLSRSMRTPDGALTHRSLAQLRSSWLPVHFYPCKRANPLGCGTSRHFRSVRTTARARMKNRELAQTHRHLHVRTLGKWGEG